MDAGGSATKGSVAEGGPKGRVRERVIWFADAIISLTPSLSRRERVIWFADAIIYDLIIY
jgi:hypothetical protein